MKKQMVELQTLEDLRKKEKISEIPESVQLYLDLEEKDGSGSRFCIEIKEKSESVSGHGIAYLNALIVKDNGAEIYTTGFMEYRGAFASDVDNRDLSLGDVRIIEESENKVLYGLRTGIGNVKIYQFQEGRNELLENFNLQECDAIRERIELIQNVCDEFKSFHSYVKSGLRNRWHLISAKGFDTDGQKIDKYDIGEKGDIVVLCEVHYDRDYDAIVDSYRIFVWKKGKGFGCTDVFSAGLTHPSGKFYCGRITFDINMFECDPESVNFEVTLKSSYDASSAQYGYHIYGGAEWEEKLVLSLK